MKKYFSIVLFIICIVTLSSCTTSNNSSTNTTTSSTTSKPQEKTLLVSAAASLKDSLNEIGELYTKNNPNIKITFNFGASGTLQQQIEQGAPADIFFSAGEKQMDALDKSDLLLKDTRKDILKNDIVLIAPTNSNLTSVDDLKLDSIQKIALGEPKSVPVGQYSEEILKYYNIYDETVAKAVYGKDVKEVLTWVEEENADCGIVYKTDAMVSSKVKIIGSFPEESHSKITYPASVIKSTKLESESKDFLNFLSSDDAKNIFTKYGFIF